MPTGYNLDRPWIRGKDYQIIPVTFAPNGTSAPTSFRGGCISSAVWTSTGTWTITIKTRGVRQFDGWSTGVQINSAANIDSTIELGAVTIGTGSTLTTIVVRNNPGGTVADIAADATNWVSVVLLGRRSVNK